MYLYQSYVALQALQQERMDHAEEVNRAAAGTNIARSLAYALGHTFVLLGNRLEQFGQ